MKSIKRLEKINILFLFIIICILGKISEEKISDTSTFYTINMKYIEQPKENINTNQSNAYTILHYSSTKNIFKKNNLFTLNSELDKHKKLLKSNNKNITINHFCKINEIKKNYFVNIKISENKKRTKININNESIPVNNALNDKNGNKQNIIINQKIKKLEISTKDGFNQNKDISCMKKIPKLLIF